MALQVRWVLLPQWALRVLAVLGLFLQALRVLELLPALRVLVVLELYLRALRVLELLPVH